MSAGVLAPIASALTLAGVGLVFRSWKRKPTPRALHVTGGWVVLLLAAPAWMAAFGWEFGAIYALTVPSLAAALFVASNIERRDSVPERIERSAVGNPAAGAVGQHALTLVLVGPFGVFTSAILTIATAFALPLGEVDRLMFIAGLTPVVWGCTAFWLASAARPARPVAVLGALTLAGWAWMSFGGLP